MARKALRKSISTRLNEHDYQQILEYSEASEIAMADLLRIGAKEYMANHELGVKPSVNQTALI
jgi:hypothetical protein